MSSEIGIATPNTHSADAEASVRGLINFGVLVRFLQHTKISRQEVAAGRLGVVLSAHQKTPLPDLEGLDGSRPRSSAEGDLQWTRKPFTARNQLQERVGCSNLT